MKERVNDMSLEDAKRFWERVKKDPNFVKENFTASDTIVEHMDKIKEMGYDFTKEEIHQVAVSPSVLEKMNKAMEDNVEMTNELQRSFFEECNGTALSDDELDLVSGGTGTESNACSWPCHGGPTS